MNQFHPKVRDHFQNKLKQLIVEYVAQVCQDYFFSYNATFVAGQLQFSFENNEIIPIDFSETIPEKFLVKPVNMIVGRPPIKDEFQKVANTSTSGDDSDDDDESSMEVGKVKCEKEHKKTFKCEYCAQVFAQKHLLVKHTRKHTGEKPYDCTLCPKTFAHLDYLIKHTRTHTGEKPFQCTQCEKAFASNQNLTAHMKFHTGDYPLVCLTCGKAFKMEESAKFSKHVKNHTVPKPNICSQCPKSFKDKYMLALHMRVHTGEKPFPCTMCDKAYQTKQNLLNHQKTHPEMIGQVQDVVQEYMEEPRESDFDGHKMAFDMFSIPPGSHTGFHNGSHNGSLNGSHPLHNSEQIEQSQPLYLKKYSQ